MSYISPWQETHSSTRPNVRPTENESFVVVLCKLFHSIGYANLCFTNTRTTVCNANDVLEEGLPEPILILRFWFVVYMKPSLMLKELFLCWLEFPTRDLAYLLSRFLVGVRLTIYNVIFAEFLCFTHICPYQGLKSFTIFTHRARNGLDKSQRL